MLVGVTACQDRVKFSPAAVPGGCCDAFRSSDKDDRKLCDRVWAASVCVNKCMYVKNQLMMSLRYY